MDDINNVEQTARYAHALQIKETMKGADFMMTIHMAGYKHQDLIINCLVQGGAEHKTGVAPAGYLEEELSEWCEELAKNVGIASSRPTYGGPAR